ncbi:amidase [Burkholderia sp. 3C]
MTYDDLPLSAALIAELVRTKAVSPVEVMERALQRIERANDQLNAFVYLNPEHAMERAVQLEGRIMRGEVVGALAGVPTAIKDLFCFYPGWPATFGGLSAMKNFRFDAAASWYPQRIESADAIVVGMTNAPALGFRGTTDNVLFGPTRNPFDLTRNSGGSSGGSTAAVAAGLIPVAHANDGGGSIRIPASWSGVFGFQPSQGRVPIVARPNGFDGVSPFIFEGPVSRSVVDAALVMSQLAGYDPRDPYSRSDRVDWIGATNCPTRGMRIGYTDDFGVFPVDAAVANVVQSAVKAFELAGAHVDRVSIKLPYSQQELSALWCRSVGFRMAAVIDGFRADGIDLTVAGAGVPEAVFQWVDVARAMSPADIVRDQIMRTAVFDSFNAAFDDFDIVASPVLGCLPVKNADERGSTVGPSQIGGAQVDPLIGWCMTYLTNFSGHPAASIPAGFSSDGLPVGMQLIGNRHADFDVMRASAEFERIRPWAASYRICNENLFSQE